jgi:hypothetical protein
MALFKSTLISAASGKLAGAVFSHNAGGAYLRSLGIPTNPNTPAQVAARAALANLAARWSLDLDDTQQASWNDFGRMVPVVNALGETRYRSGFNWFVGSNSLRRANVLADVLDGPNTYVRPAIGTLSVETTTTTPTQATIDITGPNDWAGVANARLAVFASRPQNPGRSFFKGPFRFAGAVLGNATTPPTTGAVNLPYSAAYEGSKIFFRFVCLTPDGRYSTDTIIESVTSG